MSTANHPPFNAQGTLGALFIGILISCVLFGIVTLQAYLYYKNFPEDRLRFKALVALIWFCELGHCICVCHATYYLVIVDYSNPAFLIGRLPDTLSISLVFSGMLTFVVQMSFAERVRLMSGGKLLIPVFCWTVSTLHMTMILVSCVKAVPIITSHTQQPQWKWLLTTMRILCVAVDVVIAASLCYYLSKAKDKLMKRMAKKIDKLMLWTIQTGLLTSVATVTLTIFFLAMPKSFAWIAISMFSPELFSNSLLASLNARTVVRTNNDNHTDIGATLSHGIRNTSVTNWSKGTVPGDSKLGETSMMGSISRK